jgi:hypothetical protein
LEDTADLGRLRPIEVACGRVRRLSRFVKTVTVACEP